MTGWKVIEYNLINEVSQSKVHSIAESILKNGYVGCPILVNGEELITGSHRVAALRQIAKSGENLDVLNDYVAEDVSDIVQAAFDRFEEENGYIPDLDLYNIGWIFEGTWVERYKDEIEEW